MLSSTWRATTREWLRCTATRTSGWSAILSLSASAWQTRVGARLREGTSCDTVSFACSSRSESRNARMEGAQDQPGQPDAKRRRQEPLTEAQELEAQQMLLPRDLTFKLKPSSGPVHPRAVKVCPRARMAATAGSDAVN